MHRQVEYESPEIISHILYAFRRRDRKEKCEKIEYAIPVSLSHIPRTKNGKRNKEN